MRALAAAAQALYRETEGSRAARIRRAEERRAMPRFITPAAGRPTKRLRRLV